MNKKIIGFLMVFFVCSLISIYPENAGVLKELLKPNRIYMDQKYMYVTEGESILVYSMDNLKMINKFGKKGEGPNEILSPYFIFPLKKNIFINSTGKISYYSKKGEFILEIKNNTNGRYFSPLKKGYAGFVNNIIEKNIFFTVNLYNNKLEFVKELYREKTDVKRPGKIELFKRAFMHKTYKDRIYISGKDGFILDCLDDDGKLIYSIKREGFKKHKITSEDIKNANKYFKLRYGDAFEQFKHQIVYPEYFPEIRDFKVADDRIYILPYEWNETGLKFFIYSTNGNFICEQFIPLKLKYSMQPYPFAMKDNNVYQLIENEETEQWELHINALQL